MSDDAVVVLAGGAARRMGGAAKPSLPVGGIALIRRVLAAAGDARIVVVGPPELAGLLPDGARLTREQPPGGGPAYAARAGLDLLGGTPSAPDRVALLAADLPFLTAATLAGLAAALRPDDDGAVLVDSGGRPQWLCGVWRWSALRAALAPVAPGASLHGALGGLRVRLVEPPATTAAPPWFDCDTDTDLRRAEEWTHADPG